MNEKIKAALDAAENALQAILENDGGEGSKCYSAIRWYDARQDGYKAITAIREAKDHVRDATKMVAEQAEPVATVKESLTTDMGERIADILVEDHIALMNENVALREKLAKYENPDPITEAWHGQSNINSRFNACQHKEYCVQLLERVTHKTGEPK